MKRKSDKATSRRPQGATRSTAKGREIVASLAEAVKVERAGIPLKSRLTVRAIELPERVRMIKGELP